jgi:predicted Zn finger-like uncharacterized protein
MTLIIDCPSCQRKLRVPDDLLGLKVKCPSCATTFTAGETASAPPPPPPPEPVTSGALDGGPFPSTSPGSAPEPAPSPTPPPPAWSSGEPSHSSAPTEPLPPTAPVDDHRPCPACRQSIPVEAKRCRYCGEPVNRVDDDHDDRHDHDRDDRPWERAPYHANIRRDTEPHRGTLVLVFGILSIVLGMSYIVSLVALPMGIAAWVMGQRDLRRMRMNEMDPQGEGATQAGWICGIIGTVISAFLSMCCVAQILWFAFVVTAASNAQRNNPTTRPRNRIEAPVEHMPLRLPVLPRVHSQL